MIREAKYQDAESIQNLIRIFSETGKVLFRPLDEIRENITDFQVYEKNDQIIGVCSLKTGWDQLVELRSLGVDPRYSGQGLGSEMVQASIETALSTDCDTLFVLTYAVPMFERLGFHVVDKATLPHKVWNDCNACLHQENCDETAMILSLDSIRNQHAMPASPSVMANAS
ncbi:MAG: N-acetyltransferase [Nitrospinaceae bacterium]|nr:N-acetyltransferase [Nitrospinaceae bacterium]